MSIEEIPSTPLISVDEGTIPSHSGLSGALDAQSPLTEASHFSVPYAAWAASSGTAASATTIFLDVLSNRKASTLGETITFSPSHAGEEEDFDGPDLAMLATYPPPSARGTPDAPSSPFNHYSDSNEHNSSPFSATSKTTASTATCTTPSGCNTSADLSDFSSTPLSSSPYASLNNTFSTLQITPDRVDMTQSAIVERVTPIPHHSPFIHANSAPIPAYSVEHAFSQATSSTPATLSSFNHSGSPSSTSPNVGNAPSVLVLHGPLPSHPTSSASPPKRAHANSAVVSAVAPQRPASVGPVKMIHRRQKSGKRVPPPPFSSELLKAVRLRLDRLPEADQTGSNSSPDSSYHTPSSSGSSTSGALPFSTKQYYHSRSSSQSSNGSIGGALSGNSSYDSLCSLGVPSPRHGYTLPPEIWTRVFRYMAPGELLELNSVSQWWSTACWEWVRELDLGGRHEAGFASTTWLKYLPCMTHLTRLTLTEQISTDAALASISHISSIEWLSIHCNATETSAIGLMALAQLPNLKQLALWLPSSVRPLVLQGLLARLPHLQHFKVETMRQQFLDIAFKNIGNMTSLRTLDLSWCKHLTHQTFSRIATLSSLETLILDMSGSDVALAALGQLRSLPNLTTLSLRWCDLTDAMLPTIASFRSLKTLDVSYCQYLTTAAVSAFLPHAQVIRSTPSP